MVELLYQLPTSNLTRSEQVIMVGWCAKGVYQQSSEDHNLTKRIQKTHTKDVLATEQKTTCHSSAKTTFTELKSGSREVTQTLALVVITRLQQWCRQLFWLTLICVIGCCGDTVASENKSKTIRDMRKCMKSRSSRRMKNVYDIEMQLLRHLTSPQTATLRSVSLKRHVTSRPPSPQLYDISEEVEDDC